MTRTKKLLAALIAVLMVLAVLPVAALAAEIGANAAEAKKLAMLDSAWKGIESVEKEALAKKATPSEITKAAYNAALNEPLVDEGSLVWESDIQFAFTVDGMHCLYYYTARAAQPAEAEGETVVTKFDTKSGNCAGSANVLLVGPYYSSDSSFTDQYKEEADSIAEATGGTCTKLINANATGPAIAQNYTDKGVVIYDSHGTQSGTSSYLCLTTNSGITSTDYNNGWAVSSGSAAYIDGRYIQNHVSGTLSNPLVWMAICEGMKKAGNGTTGTALIAAGAAAVYGYSQSVTFTGDYKYEATFWTEMKNGATMADALVVMKDQWGVPDPDGDAYPIVMSPVDSFPSNPDAAQDVNCDWTLFSQEPIALESFEIANSSGTAINTATMALGKSFTVKILANPSNANNYTTVWTTSNPSVVSVNAAANGKTAKLTGTGVGSATLTATVTTESKSVLTKTIDVVITEAPKWNPTTTIVPDEEYLIGFEVGGTVYLAVNYNVSASNHYYNSISSNYYGYTAPALMQGESVIGVSGNADDLDYCTWKFETASGGHIYSGHEDGYYLQVYSGSSYEDLYPGTNSNYTWTYDPINNTLYTYTSQNRYAQYYTNGSMDMMRVTGTAPTNGVVKLFSLSAEDPDPEATYYNVIFMDWDGTVLSTQRVKEGNDAVAPANPYRPHYTFIGWDVDFTNVQSDLTVTAQYEEYVAPEGYATVILTAGDVWNDGSGYQMLLDANAVAYGTIIPESGPLTSSGDASAETYAEFEYKIPENADGACSTSNVVVDNSVMITIPAGMYDWVITNPTPGDRVWIASNDGECPGRYDDFEFLPNHTYEFTVAMVGEHDGVTLEDIDGEATYYTVTFLDWDGTVLKTQRVREGSAATAPENPTRPGYSFAGWDPADFSNITADLTVTATYVEKTDIWVPTDTIVPNKEYLIGFVVDGVTYLAAETNDSGSHYNNVSSTYYGYTAPATMDGENVVDVSGSVTNLDLCKWTFETGTFDGYQIRSSADNSYYLVTWSSASYDDLYTSTGTNFYWNWDASNKTLYRTISGTNRYAQYINVSGNDQMCVTSNVPSNCYVQLFVESVIIPEPTTYYTVTFVDWDGTVLSTQQVEEGQDAVAPANPSRIGYTFTGWDTPFTNVQSDLTVTACYELNRYQLVIVYQYEDGSEAAPTRYDLFYAYNEEYSIESPAITGYTPDPAVVEGVMGNTTNRVYVTYHPNTYTLTINYVDENGNPVADPYTTDVLFGDPYHIPSPEIAGYTTETTMVDGVMDEEGQTITVVYTAVVVPPTGLIGDVNCDGVVDFSDASALAAYLMGGNAPSEEGLANADANQDGSVTIADITAIYAIIFG